MTMSQSRYFHFRNRIAAGVAWCSCLVLPLAATAVPTISNVSMSQDVPGGTVEICYEISGEPGIVTVDIRTNDVSIGDANIHYLTGDVNRKIIPDGKVRKIHWAARKSWKPVDPNQTMTAVVRAWALDAPPDYMVVDLDYDGVVSFYTSEAALPYAIQDNLYKTEYLVMRKVPAQGVVWMMGVADTGTTARHRVSFSADYYIGVYEVTLGQYRRLMGAYPDKAPATDKPDAEVYPAGMLGFEAIRDMDWPNHEGDPHYVSEGTVCFAMRAKAGGIKFDLPTEAQWEYACRSGFGATILGDGSGFNEENAKAVGWSTSNSDNQPHPVGERKPSIWGLYDMHGNMSEWTLDRDSKADRSQGAGVPVEDPLGPTTDYDQYKMRMACGGAYNRPYTTTRCDGRLKSGSETIYTSKEYGMRFCCPAIVP